jgi:zinc transport system substrate-binding protein
MVEVIRDELKKFDPPHEADYERRAKEYVARLEKLHEDGKAALKGKKNRKIVTSHESLHYFAESFDIDVADVIELQPGAEPDEAKLEELVKKCKDEDVRVFATEPQFKLQGTVDIILKELRRKGVDDVKVIDVDPLEALSGGDKLDAGWYERRMRANIDALKDALQ